MKIVINGCYGGFELSREAGKWLLENEIEDPFKEEIERQLNGRWYGFIFDYEDRTHPLLVKCVETLGSEANADSGTELVIVEVPGDLFRIEECDGMEHVVTPHTYHFIKNKYNE